MSPLPRRLRPAPDPDVLEILTPLREGFLRLHKGLVDAERLHYEAAHGPISNTQYLQLLIHEPSFSWLQPFLQLVVRIDEALEAETALTLADAFSYIAEAKNLLQPNQSGSPAAQRFTTLLQEHDAIVHVYAELRQYLKHHEARGDGD